MAWWRYLKGFLINKLIDWSKIPPAVSFFLKTMAGTATLMALKANSEARSAEDRMAADRYVMKCSLLLFV
jgi:hypothetical protein